MNPLRRATNPPNIPRLSMKLSPTPLPVARPSDEEILSDSGSSIGKWLIVSEYSQFTKGEPSFERFWQLVTKSSKANPSLKARMLLPRLVGEAGDIWIRLFIEYNKEKDLEAKNECLRIFYWLRQYEAMSKPSLEIQLYLERALIEVNMPLPDDNFWKQLDYKAVELVERSVVSLSHLIPQTQFEIFWKKLNFDQMDPYKAAVLLICLYYMPPHFWKDKALPLCEVVIPKIGRDELQLDLFKILAPYRLLCQKPDLFEAFVNSSGARDQPFVAKGLFNLIWSNKETITPSQLLSLMQVIVTPLELQLIALEINARHLLWSDEDFRKVLSEAIFIEAMAMHFSPEVWKRYFNDNRDLNDELGMEKRFERAFKESTKDSKSQRIESLKEWAVHFLWVERWPFFKDEETNSRHVNQLLKIAEGLSHLNSDDLFERKIFSYFHRRGLALLNAEQLKQFCFAASSLSNRFNGDQIYLYENILSILTREMKNGGDWFSGNMPRFVEMMERPTLFVKESDWTDWNQIVPLYQLYLTTCPQGTDWIVKAICRYVNRSGPESQFLNEALGLLNAQNCNFLTLKQAVTPGPRLLELLRRVQVIAPEMVGGHPQLHEWAQNVLRRNSDSEAYWQEAFDLFQSIASKLGTPKKVKGKGKVTSFKQIWMGFQKKINASNTPQEVLQRTIEFKRTEAQLRIREAFSSPHRAYEEKFQKFCENEVEPSSYEEELRKARMDALEGFRDVFSEIAAEKQRFEEDLNRDLEELESVTKASLLETQLANTFVKIEKDVALKSNELTEKVKKIGEKLFETMALLKERETFELERSRLLALPPPQSCTKPYVSILGTQKKIEKKIWENRISSLKTAQDSKDLKAVEEESHRKLSASDRDLSIELVKVAIDKIPSRETRESRMLEHQKRENEELKQKLKRKKEKIALLSTQNVNAKTIVPEIKSPVIEKSVRMQLIEKFQILAKISENARKALPLIQQEGKFLRSIPEVVQFLKLFHITYQRTTGSHKVYSDGEVEVVIANHTGETTPEELDSALKAVLCVVLRTIESLLKDIKS